MADEKPAAGVQAPTDAPAATDDVEKPLAGEAPPANTEKPVLVAVQEVIANG